MIALQAAGLSVGPGQAACRGELSGPVLIELSGRSRVAVPVPRRPQLLRQSEWPELTVTRGSTAAVHRQWAGTAAVGGLQLLSHDTTTDGQLTPSLSRFVVHCSLLSTAGYFSGLLQHGTGPVAVLRPLAELPCSVCDNTGRVVHNTSPALQRRT